MEVILDGNSLSIEQICSVARDGATVSASPEARAKMQRSRDVIERCVAEGTPIYGVTTGIGEFARISISTEQSAELQRRIIYSHSAGTGDPQPEDVVRAAMLVRANTLAKGYSGVRLSLLDTVLGMINKGVVPYINEKGSVGTSGDLSPLSQFAEVAIGEGRAYYKGELMSGAEAMKRAGVKPTDLTYKEGLGLINGSQMMTAGAALLLYDAERIVKNAMIAGAMTVDALRAVARAFAPLIHSVRPYPGQNAVAANLLRLVADSDVMVVPSVWYENSPIVIQEARAAGVPVVASGHGALAEKIRHGVDGLLFPPGDALALRQALLRLVEEPDLLPRLREGIPPPMDMGEHVDQLEEIYRQVVQR